VYGAGWLAEPGLAFGKNPPFLPNGSVFTRMIAELPGGRPFGARDLYAAFLLLESGKRMGFGRGGSTARRQTKFLYYFVFINLLRDALQKEQQPSGLRADVAIAVSVLLDATRGDFDRAILITADSDQIPLVKAIMNDFPNKRITLAAPPGRAGEARELGSLVHERVPITVGRIRSCIMPTVVHDDRGQVAAIRPTLYGKS
jgi:hypothetical protein